MTYDPTEFDGPPNPAAIDPSADLLALKEDSRRMDWLLKNSCIKVNNIYYTTRESLDEAIRAAESANVELCDLPNEN